MMNDDEPAQATGNDIIAALDLVPGTAGIPRLLDAVIWHVRNARAATQSITEEDKHPAENWTAVTAKWDHVTILVAELRDRSEKQASQ
jgi:hypothetical protein